MSQRFCVSEDASPNCWRSRWKRKRADEIPKVFTAIHLKYRVKGARIKESDVQRAIELSIDKYCSATQMLSSTADVTFEFELIQ